MNGYTTMFNGIGGSYSTAPTGGSTAIATVPNPQNPFGVFDSPFFQHNGRVNSNGFGSGGSSSFSTMTPMQTGNNFANIAGAGAASTRQNLTNAAQSTTQANTLAQQTAETLNEYASDAFYRNLDNAFPNWREMFGQMEGNTNSLLQGQIPADVADMIRMTSAEQGIQGGLEGTARNLGLTSLDLATQGHSQGMDLFGISQSFRAPTADVFGIADSVRQQLISAGSITPAQVLDANIALNAQNLRQWETKMNDSLARDRMYMDNNQFQQKMDWDRELSGMNRDWAMWQWNEQKSLLERAQAARSSEQLTFLNAMRNSTLTQGTGIGAGSSTSTTRGRKSNYVANTGPRPAPPGPDPSSLAYNPSVPGIIGQNATQLTPVLNPGDPYGQLGVFNF